MIYAQLYHTFSSSPFTMNSISFRDPTDDSLSRAKRNVERYYQLVGVCEEMDKFIKLVEFGLPDYFAGAHKIYGIKSKSSEISISLLYCFHIAIILLSSSLLSLIRLIIVIIIIIVLQFWSYYHYCYFIFLFLFLFLLYSYHCILA